MEHPENEDKYKGLKVNKGVSDMPTVNPYLKKRVQRKRYTADEYVAGILDGNITILSQAVTLVESSLHEHQEIAQEIIEKCLPHAGKSVRVGITGVPGAGKSTSIDSFGMHLINAGHKLAVLAIDPSSERSKGSILGDKTRMEALSREKNAFKDPRDNRLVRGGGLRYDLCRNCWRRTERDRCSFDGGFLPVDPAGRYRRRAARHQAWYHGDGGRYYHQQGGRR